MSSTIRGSGAAWIRRSSTVSQPEASWMVISSLSRTRSRTPGTVSAGSPLLIALRKNSELNSSATSAATPRCRISAATGRLEPMPKLRPATTMSPGRTSSVQPGRRS
jgi:hypothetical protein